MVGKVTVYNLYCSTRTTIVILLIVLPVIRGLIIHHFDTKNGYKAGHFRHS